jgi:predicted RNA-binding protein associated with RNAse of E/G family
VNWDGTHEDRVYSGPSVVRIHVWGTAHTVLRPWNFERDRAEGWYVNLEAPWRRTPIGFDSQDHALDVTVADDLSSWAWKDEDELAWCVEVGKYSGDQAAEFRAEGERVIAAIESRSWPFCEDWSRWRPDVGWPVPVLPDGWSEP